MSSIYYGYLVHFAAKSKKPKTFPPEKNSFYISGDGTF